MDNSKYLKYKQKYLDLKNQTQIGGLNKMVYKRAGLFSPYYFYVEPALLNNNRFILYYLKKERNGSFTATGQTENLRKEKVLNNTYVSEEGNHEIKLSLDMNSLFQVFKNVKKRIK